MSTNTPNDSPPTVWNLQSIVELLSRELARSESSGSNLIVLLARVEFPKDANGDLEESRNNLLLVEVAKRVGVSLRQYDYVGRYGPRQFLILVPGWDPLSANALAEKLRRAATESPINVSGSRTRVAMSVAAATTVDFRAQDLQQVLTKLEAALDRAGANGGNRVAPLTSLADSGPRFPRKRRMRIVWMSAAFVAVAVTAAFFLMPSWSCAPNLIGDLLDSRELPPPLPPNCVLTAERPSDNLIQSLDKQCEASQLELQGRVSCKIAAASRGSGRNQDQQWMGNFYTDGTLQYRRHILIAASEDVAGGKLFTVEQCITPWFRYLSQSQEYCRTEEPPWK